MTGTGNVKEQENEGENLQQRKEINKEKKR